MSVIAWGKPRIFVKDLDAEIKKWMELPTPVMDSTQLTPTKGDKKEAKVEGGANEDVRYGKNTYLLALQIRKAKGRNTPIPHEDGVVAHNYAVVVLPEDPETPGIAIEKATVSVEDTFTAAAGAIWGYNFDALQPAAGNQVKDGIITVTEAEGNISKIEITPLEDAGEKVEVAPDGI